MISPRNSNHRLETNICRPLDKGLSFGIAGGSIRDQDCHNRRNGQDCQNRHGCLFVLHFEPQNIQNRLLNRRNLEAQQRYFSYCALLVAMVSQNSCPLVFVGYCTIIARCVAKSGIPQMCLHHFGKLLTSLKKYRARYGVSQQYYRNIAGDMGPLWP